jgi:monoamine oxidase
MSTSRRDFIKFVVAGSVAASCPLELEVLAQAGPKDVVDGEHNEICHQVRDGHVFSRPPVSARHDVVIVGGGVSGLTAASLMPSKDWLLLEKEPHWGGNAYLEDYYGATYATGAAFAESEAAWEMGKALGLPTLPINDWDGTLIKGEFVPDTWGDGLDHLPYPATVRESFKKFRAEMLKINLKQRAEELDNVSFGAMLKGYAPEVKLWWDTYGPSNWGTLADETAAGVALEELQWMAAPDRKDDRSTWPGGLGAISKALAAKLAPQYSGRMITGATIVSVVPQKQEVHVTYIRDRELKTVAAKAVIMATPKFITSRVVEGLPDKQRAAMRQVRYAPYPVVNIIYDRPVFNKGYDNWCPGNTFTDFIVADWVIRNQARYQQKYNILTFYTPLRESQRSMLLTETGARHLAENVLRDFQKLTAASARPVEVEIYRRGHPMYMAVPGNYTRVLPLTRVPMDRVFFACTDSEGPVSTTSTAILAAQRAVKELEQRLAGSAHDNWRPPVPAAVGS